MAGKSLHLICVGRLKIQFFRAAGEHYLSRIQQWREVICTEIRDGEAGLPVARRNAEEGRRILRAIGPRDIPIALDEHGKEHTSVQLAEFLRQLDGGAAGRPCFIIGGAYGLDDSVRGRARHMLALSAMTLPHELARIVLLEQLYRAECILRKNPYHH